MHPLVIIVPAAVLVFGPRLWVKRILKQHNGYDARISVTGRAFAREILDRHQLQNVKVEGSDIGDHYDPEMKVVRLARDKLDRKSLTALTTAAHEVAHAIQDAGAYAPFRWRIRLAKIAQVTGEVGMLTMLSIPVTRLLTGYRFPAELVYTVVISMLGTGMVAQIAAVPTEIDASFRRALPILRDGYIDEKQLDTSRRILFACSLTYVASSLVSISIVPP